MLKLDRVLYSAPCTIPATTASSRARCTRTAIRSTCSCCVKEQTFPGCQIDVRPLGVLKMLDRGEPDDKILGVPCTTRITGVLRHRRHPAAHLKEVEHFFHIYKDLEGKRVEIIGWEKSDDRAMRDH